ncbi:hypothetical protein PHAVU_002G246200 [Phaseolus vulgaris]|uniref:Uncharacterized protein n=1 Tax=Phaseolus vulgaris TaxID=3885 RepID=V7CQJ7_PHAVU|nr:hypothetical protein PHAVU_002G246200g [Phaseolus vulgaris]ESW31535.1 hypothetical protein PHAVU_002G246200g [Phaseolus vulgaris]
MLMPLPREVPRIKRRASRTLPLAGSYALSSSNSRLSFNAKRDDLLNTEFDNFDTILDEFDKLHDQGHIGCHPFLICFLFAHTPWPRPRLNRLAETWRSSPRRGCGTRSQEEEWEQLMDFVPDISANNTDHIEVDKETMDMLHSLELNVISGITQVDPVPVQQNFPFTRRY